MQVNVGIVDRVLRIIVGLALLAVALFIDLGIWRWLIGIFGGIQIVTAICRFCPLYPMLKINTNKKSSA